MIKWGIIMDKTALLIIDIQEGLTKEHPIDESIMINHVQRLIDRCHRQSIEVIYVRHHDEGLPFGSDEWQIDKRILPSKNEKIFDKQYNSAFKETGLQEYLDSQGIKQLIIVGMQSEYCIDTTCRVAFELGYKLIIPRNATTTFNNEYISGKVLKQYLEERVWNQRFAAVVDIDEIEMMFKDKYEYHFSYGKTDFKDAANIRRAVFVDEQGFENEFDEIDETAYHIVIYDKMLPIATGRMYPKDQTTMILGRIATIKEYRGQSIGSLIVTLLENKARELNYRATELSAQQRAQGFYEKLNYQVEGDTYFDEWCLHVKMRKDL